MLDKPKILSTAVVAKSALFTVESLQLSFSNGQQRQFERVRGRSKGSVMIVPMLDNNTVLLIREYGAGVDDYVLAFPKGAMEDNEELFVTANRELMEEIGYGAHHFESLARLSDSPSYMTSRMDIIVARDLYPQRLPGDEPEVIEVVPWDLSRVDELLIHPQFHEARSIAALLILMRRQHGVS